MVDVARLGLAVDSSQVEKGTVSLHQLTGAAGQASVAAQKLAGASQIEAAGQKAATSATIAHTAALNAQHAVMRSTAQQRTMMVYQLNDIAVSLASGMNPAMVAMQQGSQILQGGFMPAVRTLGDLVGGLVTKFWPLAAVIGVASAAIAGMTHEINETSAVTVSFGDTALATWQVIAGGIYEIIRPAVELLGGWFGTAWDWVVQATKDAGNWIIRSIVGSIEYVKTSIGTLPSAFVVAGQAAAQGLADAVAGGINSIIGNINSLSAGINQLAGSKVLGQIGAVNFGQIDFGGAAAQQSYEESWGQFNNTKAALGERDFMGEFFGAISGRAQELALARKEAEELGGAASAANDNVKALDDTSKSLAETWGGTLKSAWGGFWSDFHSGIKEGKGLWESLGGAAVNALDKLASKAMEMAANGIWDLLFGALGSTLGFGSIGIGSGMPGVSSITGSSGGFFPAFSGGGYTGSGSRSGGMDGQGGFLAMMHPNETVIDHARGQAANQNGGTSVVRIELGPGLEGRMLQKAAGQTVQIVQQQVPPMIDSRAPAANARAQRNKAI